MRLRLSRVFQCCIDEYSGLCESMMQTRDMVSPHGG